MAQGSSSRSTGLEERDKEGVGMVVGRGSSFSKSKESDKGRKGLGGGRKGVILGGRMDMKRE